MELSKSLQAEAAACNIVVFEGRLITDAQPPITEAQLKEVEEQIGRKIPPGLLQLWQTAFGGTLDYALDVDFAGHVSGLSLTELFYPDSDGYNDLEGWIENEFECAYEAGDENADNGILSFVPIGGYEYLTRIYVCLEDCDDYGAVYAWQRGIPPAWSLRLHDDSLARIAEDVPSFFRLLALEADPFDPNRPEFCSGCNMVEAIDEIREQRPELADALAKLVRHTVLDWRAALDNNCIAKDKRVRRLAMLDAAERGDLELVEKLHAQGCDLQERFNGGGNILDHFLADGHDEAATLLIEHGVDPSNAILSSAASASAASVEKLLAKGAKGDTVSAKTAALQGLHESSRLMVDDLANRLEWDALYDFSVQLEQSASYYEQYLHSRPENIPIVANVRKLLRYVRLKLPLNRLSLFEIFVRFLRL